MPHKTLIFLAFAATVPIANWMIGNVGTVCNLNGPCLIPVGFGLMAPSGVLMVGVALVLRDMIHEQGGIRLAFAAIATGAILSFAIAPPALALASFCAFTIAEVADLTIYARLRERSKALAVVFSGTVGAVVDSAVFLSLAFGGLEYLAGNTLGKVWASVAVACVLASLPDPPKETE